ncbi:MAG TPA: hypothetical protein VHP33_28325 [Polyangiaceae bacterium]|nr:hypothetical protein [Polyangiaceae bacterium]
MRDTFSGKFSIATAVAFVIGGIAALLLAAALALDGYGRPGRRAPSGAAAGGAARPPASSSAPPEAEVEYLLDSAEPASSGH